MKKVEVAFLLCTVGFAGSVAVMSLSEAISLLPGRTASDSNVVLGVAGKSREVDMEKLLPMLRRRDLSDHEAEFYKEFDVGRAPPGNGT